MMHHAPRPDTVTVLAFAVFDQDWREMRAADCKATREAIAAMRWAKVLEGTAEDVPRSALDAEGRYRRLPTGWGALS